MISREEQHAFEIEYKHIGSISFVEENVWAVSLFDGFEIKKFTTELEAISFVKRKTMVFQKQKQLGLSVQFNKREGIVTHLLFPNYKTVNPFEVSTFYWNQIQVNVDPKQKAKRVDQLVPIKVSFNDIARVSSYTSPQKVRTLGILSVLSTIAILIYVIAMAVFMLSPSDSSKIISDATGLPYESTPALITGYLALIFAVGAIVILFYPYLKYYKIAHDESGGYSFAGKSWKKPYVDRIFANWVALGLMIVAILLAITNNYYVSDTIFFTSVVHSARTWMMVVFLIITDISFLFFIGVIVWQLTTTYRRTKNFLSAHVDPEDVDLFKAWTTHKRIESKEYIYDYMTKFTFPPTMERLRVISDEIYPKKIRMMDKTRDAKKKDIEERYNVGLGIYKSNIKTFNKKQGI